MGQGGLGRDPPAGVILQELLRRKDKRLNLGATRVGRGTPFAGPSGTAKSLRGCLNPELCEASTSEVPVCLSVYVWECVYVQMVAAPMGAQGIGSPGTIVTLTLSHLVWLLGTELCENSHHSGPKTHLCCLPTHICQASWPVNARNSPVSGPHPPLGAWAYRFLFR